MALDSPALFPSIDQMEERKISFAPAQAPAAAEAPEAEVPAAAEVPAEAEVPEAVEVALAPVPYSKEVVEEINSFYRKRAKNSVGFTYTSSGDLEIKEGAKVSKVSRPSTAGTIRLKMFVPLEPSERASLDDARSGSLAALDAEYEEEHVRLVDAWEEYRRTGSMHAVLASNQAMTDIDARRNLVRTAVRNVVSIPNPVTRDIILSDRYEERKLFPKGDPFNQEVARLAIYTFKQEDEFGKYVDDEGGEVQEKVEEEANDILTRQKLKDGRFARVFYETDSEANGFMSPMWMADFTMIHGEASTNYSSPIQAYESEKAKELGKVELREKILKTRSPRTIRLLVRQEKEHPKDARGLWLKIYTAMYNKYPNLQARLLATGSDTLIFADSKPGPSSVGLAEKDSGVLDPTKWRGENAVGLAQETVRTRLREQTLEEAPEVEEADESTVTEEQQRRAKTGAIINARRGGRR